MKKFFAVFVIAAIFCADLALSNIQGASAQNVQKSKAQFATFSTQCKGVYPSVKRPFQAVITSFSIQLCYNGARVWTTRVDCNLTAVGGTASNSWCGTSVNNNSYVEFGNNYTFVPWGSWFQTHGYNRYRYNAYGNYLTNYGN